MNLKHFLTIFAAVLCVASVSECYDSEINAFESEIKIYEFTRHENKSHPGKKLINHVLEEFTTKKQVLHCAFECLKSSRCKSFNYGRFGGNVTCQLNDATHEDFADSFTDEPSGTSWEYHLREAFSIDDEEGLGPCAKDPCQNGGRCLDTMNWKNERTYYCLCKEGWDGKNCDVESHRIDWGEWQDWGECSVTCATGWKSRRRACVDMVTGEETSAGRCYGHQEEYMACHLQSCPQWKLWSEWSVCSTENTCGSGVKVRHRECSNGGTAGVDRYCLGFSNETAPCKSIDCRGRLRLLNGPDYGEGRVEMFNDIMEEWSPFCIYDTWTWFAANVICKQIGFIGADKAIDDGRYGNTSASSSLLNSVVNCNGTEKTIQACPRMITNECQTPAGVQCQVRGGWNLWTPWSDCSVTCENGTRTRTRDCNFPPPNHNGQPCPGDSVDYKDCTEPMCPSTSEWGPWGPWSACDVTCGEGVRKRLRVCSSDTLPCLGNNQTFDICTMSPCSVDGVWSEWTDWSECDVTCANGTRFRTRVCNGPFYGGAQCPGEDNEVDDCFPRMCEVDGVWEEWSPWTQCTTTCGYGNRNRSRTCYGPFYGGKECPGDPSEIEVCNAFSCPVDGKWKLWSEWGECSVTCGGGLRNRSRECDDPEFGGSDCPGPSEESESCNEQYCPIDGVFTEWAYWSECSVTCANGTRYRQRECVGPFHGGSNCTGNWDEIEICVAVSCPVDGVWNSWEAWQNCNVTCGGGTRQRMRQCDGPYFDGLDCVGLDTDQESCNEHECPIDGVWDLWSAWSICSLTCGGGTQNRSRECIGPLYDGADCVGLWNETQDCNTQDCPVDGDWTIWTMWTECNVTCGGGSTWRTRECVEPLHGGANCTGPSMMMDDCNTQPCPIDGVWNMWSNWTECTLTCGNGSQSRERTCDGPYHDGAECEGEFDETQLCNTFPCPVDGVWFDWEPWGECSKTCGRGEKIRLRECDGPYYGGANCTGDWSETEFCATSNCPVDGAWLTWGAWSECSTTCENGTAVRNRTCYGPYHGGQECVGDAVEEKDCFLRMCPVDGVWTSWTNWTECPVTCAGGIQNRTRECIGTKHGGAYCDGPEEQSRDCNINPCPIDGQWTLWSRWSSCNVSCGGGSSDRYRVCTESQYGGSNCTGNSTEVRSCNEQECPIDGVWEMWSNWTECSLTCGTGDRHRYRHCEGPYFGGQNCTGPGQEMENCNTHECPIDGQWSDWMVWTACNASCGGGVTIRARTCQNAAYGGNNCVGPSQEMRYCNRHPCPIDGVWETWAPWENCNTTCGGGIRLRFRNCTGPFYGGAECPGINRSHEDCNTHECPIDGVWELWSAWEGCSVTCGGGNQTRSRTCTGPFYGGQECPGNWTETQQCNTFECPIDGMLMEWSDFYECSVTCGGGIQWRNRTCFGPFYGGANCSEPLDESRACNTHHCPIDGVYMEWSAWGKCSLTCGGGEQLRNRTCDGPFYNGSECQGPAVENRTCNTYHCPVDGIWLDWSSWDPCAVTCGGSSHQRRRVCDGPFYDGANCTGPWEETQECNTNPCPVDGVFEPWSEWYECSLTCGTGIQWRNRTCTGPFHGGVPCDGPYEDSQDCNTHECPIDGEWSSWGIWSDCDATCGGGSKVRIRSCVGQEHGGAACIGAMTNMQFCNEHNCPVDGVWNPWQPWGNCSVTCGGGIVQRMRECNGPLYGGKNCSGAKYETLNCSSESCPVDGVWDQWQGWSGCNVTCGGGLRIRIRECIGPFHDGAPCEGQHEETDICGTALCPIPGDWGEWTEWSLCSATCDGGKRNRSRICDLESYGNLTTDCDGEPTELVPCNTFNCLPLARHCADWAARGLNQSCMADVDPDGEETLFEPKVVECDFDSEPGKALTLLRNSGENRTQVKGWEGAGEYQIELEYDVGWGEAIKIVDSSAECKQYMRWECLAAIIHNPYNPDMLTTFWMNRTEQMTNYFGGATPDSGNCACGETNSCFNTSLPCNCDTNDEVWRVDDGFVTNKAELPIHSFYAGDTGGDTEDGYRYIGPCICWGIA